MRKVLKAGLVFFIFGVLTWILFPLYGFVSQQYETARLPWGWSDLPNQPVPSTFISTPPYDKIADQATKILLRRRQLIDAPSLSAAVAVNDQVIWAAAAGWRDIQKQLPATPYTSYRIGSSSKAVAITGLARLVKDKEVDLDAPISGYVNDLPNAAWKMLTARQLASHTAGLAAYEENNDWLGFYQSLALTSHYADPHEALDVFDGADMLHSAGEKFHYSGFDNVLLSAIMQSAAKMPFDEFMHERVFKPLNLSSIQPSYSQSSATEKARSYQVKGKTYKPWRKVNLSHKLAAGGYVATPSNLALLGTAWLDDGFIPPSLREDFWTPVKLSNGAVNKQDYALGFRRKSWPIESFGQVEHLNHGGVSKGAQCWFMIIPEYNMAIAISTNRRTDDFFDFADVYVDLLELFLPVSAPRYP